MWGINIHFRNGKDWEEENQSYNFSGFLDSSSENYISLSSWEVINQQWSRSEKVSRERKAEIITPLCYQTELNYMVFNAIWYLI